MSSTYNTKQKQHILSLLSRNADQQLTCDDIAEMLKGNGTPVGKSTVYRYLLKLEEEGKVRKFIENSKCAYFRYIENTEDCNGHLHLKCLSCGDFIHLDCELMDDISVHLVKDHHFKIDNSKTVLYGLCENCNQVKE